MTSRIRHRHGEHIVPLNRTCALCGPFALHIFHLFVLLCIKEEGEYPNPTQQSEGNANILTKPNNTSTMHCVWLDMNTPEQQVVCLAHAVPHFSFLWCIKFLRQLAKKFA